MTRYTAFLKAAATLAALAASSGALAQIDASLRGTWAPDTKACAAGPLLRVAADTITVVEGDKSKTLGDVDVCHSCAGGARYQGIVKMVTTEFSTGKPTPLMVVFNADERRGVARVDIIEPSVGVGASLAGKNLRKCKDAPGAAR